MHCPFCSHEDTKVIDSRNPSGDTVRRRRECIKCNSRFTTLERAEIELPMVIKQNGTRQSFDESKLRKGILSALQKRAIPAAQIDNLIQEIVQALLSQGHREINSRTIGEMVMSKLKALDAIAYIRFASVYLNFQELAAFQNAIDELTHP